jgi:hypothetical protein
MLTREEFALKMSNLLKEGLRKKEENASPLFSLFLWAFFLTQVSQMVN